MKFGRFVLNSVAARIGSGLQRSATLPVEVGSCAVSIITAPTGSGMTTSIRQAADINGWMVVEVHSGPNPRELANSFHRAVCGDDGPLYFRVSAEQTTARVLRSIQTRIGPWGPFIIHNLERLNERQIDFCLDFGDRSGLPICLCGTPSIRHRIASAPAGSLLEKLQSRIVLDVDVSGPSLQDARLMADELAEITIDADLVEFCYNRAGTSVRALLAQFRAIEEVAAVAKLERLGLDRWLALSGEPEVAQVTLATPKKAMAALPRLKALSKLERGHQAAAATKSEVA